MRINDQREKSSSWGGTGSSMSMGLGNWGVLESVPGGRGDFFLAKRPLTLARLSATTFLQS